MTEQIQTVADENRVYVEVDAIFGSDGSLRPYMLIWKDGTSYLIERVTEIRPTAAPKNGGTGERFTIWVNGKQRYIYFERCGKMTGNRFGRWFVEKKSA